MMKRFFAAALAALSLVAGCATMKGDRFISSSREQLEISLAELERLVVALDTVMPEQERQTALAAARRMALDMEKESEADADYAARLAAWSGRIAILEGRYSEAVRLHRRSRSLSPGNLPSIILGIRLEGDPVKRLELAERELSLAGQGAGELQIEKGRALVELRRFGEAVAFFDSAFASGLDSVYAETYRPARERAWELRNAEGYGGTLAILEQGGVNWKNCVSLIQRETRLLYFLTAGKDVSETELFNRLVERGYIPATQDVSLGDWPSIKPRIEDPVFRSGAAWLIWHLYAENRAGRGLLSKYSARFASGTSPRSPIADLSPLSPFFDSILGCVETELLSLPDGKNFRPAEPVRGAELLAILKKIGT
jgi:tetratricopeptide (TPR) repeat protein